MTGTHHGAIDFDWLVSNIDVGEVPYGVDQESVGTLKTFVLGPKAIYAAESYILGLFQLYPTVYFHKTTRGAEKLFSEILQRTIELVRDDSGDATGLPKNHPIVLFAKNPDKIENVMKFDDAVFWGALPLMVDASDPTISTFSKLLRDRKLFKCYDVREAIANKLDKNSSPALINRLSVSIERRVEEWVAETKSNVPRILFDRGERDPYRMPEESKGPLNQIRLKTGQGEPEDVAKLSRVVAAIEPFKLFRLYAAREDTDALNLIGNTVSEEARRANA